MMCNLCRFLGNLYAAEALIKLNRVSEAISHLSCDNITDIGPTVDDGGGESYSASPWFV